MQDHFTDFALFITIVIDSAIIPVTTESKNLTIVFQELFQCVNALHRSKGLHGIDHFLTGHLIFGWTGRRVKTHLMGINWNVTFSALFDAHLGEEIGGELVTTGQFEGTAIHLELVANIEIVNSVELMIIWWWKRNTMTSDQGT